MVYSARNARVDRDGSRDGNLTAAIAGVYLRDPWTGGRVLKFCHEVFFFSF